jgi:hypothetical protein
MNPKKVPTHRREPDGGDAFLPDFRHATPRRGNGKSDARDPLADMVALEYIEAVTSGEERSEDVRDAITDDEVGGPFVEHSAAEEFATDREYADEEAPTEREAFPTAMRGAPG